MGNENEQEVSDLFNESEQSEVTGSQEQGGGGEGGETSKPSGEEGGGAKETLQGLSADQLKAIVSGAVSEVTKKDAKTDESDEPTQEQLAKMIQFFDPDDNLVTALRHEEPAEVKKALVNLIDGITRQAVSVIGIQMQQELRRRDKAMATDLGFVKSFARQQHEQQLVKEFYEAYPQYKGLDPLLAQIKSGMEAEGRRFNSKQEAFKAVHEKATTILASLGLKPGQTNSDEGDEGETRGGAEKTTAARRMSTLSGGGQGGAGGSGGSPKAANSTARELFG